MLTFIHLGYLLAIVSFIVGLKFMSSPVRAKTGNLIAALGMILAVVTTFVAVTTNLEVVPTTNLVVLFAAVAAGSIVGKRFSDKVEMTAMPQLVSLFNATGGGCAMLLGLVEANKMNVDEATISHSLLLIAGMVTGAIAFSGSILAERKLAGKAKDRRSYFIMISARILLVLIFVLQIGRASCRE